MVKSLFDISDKVIAITGAGGVLCGTMTKALGQADAEVAVLDLDEDAARKIADNIKNEALRHILFTAQAKADLKLLIAPVNLRKKKSNR